MPLPVAHTAAGLASYLVFRNESAGNTASKKQLTLALLAVIVANLPDLDFLPGLIIDQPDKFHHGPSHSLLTGGITGILVYFVARLFFSELSKTSLLLMFLTAGISHTVLDFLAIDTSFPYGVPLFWPFSDVYYISSVPVFLDVARADDSTELFFATLLNFHNVMNVLLELLLSAALIAVILAGKKRIPSPPFWKLMIVSILCFSLFASVRLSTA
jgi:inner membrane protein